MIEWSDYSLNIYQGSYNDEVGIYLIIDNDTTYFAKNMEILWLMFIMKEKYNKKWNGKEWI